MMAQERTRGNERDPNPGSPRYTVSTILVKRFQNLCLENMFWKMGRHLEIAAIEVNSAVSFLIF